MSSYSDKRKQRGKISSGYSTVGNGNRSSDGQQSMQDVDRLSLMGSISSAMSVSALEQKLKDAQARIQYLETLTTRQQSALERLQNLVKRKR